MSDPGANAVSLPCASRGGEERGDAETLSTGARGSRSAPGPAASLRSWRGQVERAPRILIVDDTATNRKLLQAILKRESYDLHEACDGGEAIRLATELQPDLILLDIMMPVKDGYAVCAELKSNPRTSETPIIFLSAKAESTDKIKGLELGAVDYITKPFNRGEILARVHTHLEIRLLSQSLREMNRELLRNQARLEEDLKAAATIQKSLLPPEEIRKRFPEVGLAWRFLPCDRIGGDIFNLHRLDQDHLCLYILDVSGHGVPSAMVTVSVSQRLNPQAGNLVKQRIEEPPYYRLPGPAEVLACLDREYPIERFDKYFTMCYLILNLRSGAVRYGRAAHPRPLVLRRSGELECLQCDGTIVGLGGMCPHEEQGVQLEPGDRLFLHTDGVVEQPRPQGDRFGDERLQRALLEGRGEELQTSCDRVLESVTRFAEGAPFHDDITLVALEYRGDPAEQ